MATAHNITHGQRTGYASLERGGLNFEAMPMRLFAKGNGKQWNPADFDYSKDAADFAAMSDAEKHLTCTLAAEFLAGEESVAQDIQPFMAAMAAEGRAGDEIYLTQFCYEEAKHAESFRRWFDAVGVTEDLHPYIEGSEAYRQVFAGYLPDSMYALAADPSPANQVRASVTYNHIVEGTLALTGYHGWNKVCASRGILPGMQQIVKHIGDDERRHMAWGTFTCRRHVAADDANWAVFEERMDELLMPALTVVADTFAGFGDEVPFGIDPDEMTEYASDKLNRRWAPSPRPAAARSPRSTSTPNPSGSRSASTRRIRQSSPPPRRHDGDHPALAQRIPPTTA